MLTRHGISWANYHPVGDDKPRSRRRHYARHRRKMARRRLHAMRPALPGVAQNVGKDIKFTADVFPLGIGRYMQRIRSTDQFFEDAANGTLPAFSLVDPDFDTLLRGEPAGHPEGRELRGRGDQRGAARQGVAGHAADLAL